MTMKKLTVVTLLSISALGVQAQSLLYPKHFDLQQVTLLDGPMKTALDTNIELLMKYDVDRLLTPFVRQAGLASTTDKDSKYYQWLTKHPNFTNWGGDAGFDLSGHVGGHYLTALALAYAASHDEDQRTRLKECMDYMLKVMKDCQDQYDEDTSGLYGFIGGQPINDSWRALYKGDLSKIRDNWGWVPFYCQHKVLAGLRDAYVYGGSDVAREMFRKLADWSVNLVSKVSDSEFQDFLNCEHGGMNESLLDAYQLFGDKKYLTAAKKYSHKAMIDGMQSLSTTFLDGKHANTQVPKYIGFERIYELDATATTYRKAAENFWTDVAQNRTVCIGGNSVGEHFLAKANSNRYIDQLDGPESCNSNNMLKLSEMLSDRTGDAKYADFYEQTLWNHILSTQDPETGGYVYFTTLRPQGYRIYSTVNKGMWCCVGTGMENHSKYGHFIYTHDGAKTLYVNLFTPSSLVSDDFVVTQTTKFPDSPSTTLTVGKGGQYAIAVRHPAWAGASFQVSVNGQPVDADVKQGTASYVTVSRTWAEGDVLEVSLPMQLRYEECPNYGDYIAFKYGPILLAAKTTVATEAEDGFGGLAYEQLKNEYAGEGRMDHAPGSVGTSKNLTSAPMLIGERKDVLSRIQQLRCEDQRCEGLRFVLDASRDGVATYQWKSLTLQPFYQIHHARYSCYWYQQTEENYQKSSMAADEAAAEALLMRTVDFVAPGEQQSEAGHEYNYSSDSSTGNYSGESYRDAHQNGYVQYSLFNPDGIKSQLAIMLRFTTADKGRSCTLTVDGQHLADITIPSTVKGANANGFYNVEYLLPDDVCVRADGSAKEKFVVRLTASSSTLLPGLYYLRLMKDSEAQQAGAVAYRFVANEWKTGDAGRVAQSNIAYDNERNVIHVKASGANNVALMLDYEHTDYYREQSQKYLVVTGTNLKTTAGSSYLWWLNGVNRGSQVQPDLAESYEAGGQTFQVFAWDMPKSQLGSSADFTEARPNMSRGMTIFGLTSTAGQADIYDISFTDDTTNYVESAKNLFAATRMANLQSAPEQADTYYRLDGTKARLPASGLYVRSGRVVAVP